MENIQESIEMLLANRVYLYELFHVVFGSEPSMELLDALSAPATSQAFVLLSCEDDDVMAKMSSFLERRKEIAVSNPDYLSHVQSEYTRLMIGPGKLIAYPWESTYNKKENLLFQESTLLVRQTYRKHGYLPEGYPHVADDHIALELHFMAKLSGEALNAFQDGDRNRTVQILKDQINFLQQHMLNWLPRYAQDIGKSDTMYMYPQFGLAVSEFIRIDHELATEIAETLSEDAYGS